MSSSSDTFQRPRVRAAAIYSVLLIAALYLLYRFVHPGWPFSLLLAPALLGNGVLLALLSGAGMDVEGSAAQSIAWLGGALVMGYVYYKLIYFGLWLLGIHQPIKPGADPDANPVRDNEGGWVTRALIVLAIPAVLAFLTWRSVTDYDNQYSDRYDLVRAAAEVACDANAACEKRISSRFDDCFEANFVEVGRRWLRPRYDVEREPFRACLFGSKPVPGS